MFSKMQFSILLFVASMSSYANNIMHPLLQIPNTKKYLMVLHNNDMMHVFLVDPYASKVSDSGSVGISPDDKAVSVFYNDNKNISRVYVLVKEKVDEKSIAGFYYTTYKYDLDKNKISIDRTEIMALENCFDGVNKTNGVTEVCKYKDAASVLRFLKTGK